MFPKKIYKLTIEIVSKTRYNKFNKAFKKFMLYAKPGVFAESEEYNVIDAVSCGGVVIFKGKILLLYKNQNGRYMGWVMPKGTVEPGETFKETALREVKEESDVDAKIIKYIGKTQYTFRGTEDIINKTVHWYFMTANSFHYKPQAEEFFADAGFYKQHEAYYLLKFHDEKQIMRRAYLEYLDMRNKENSIRYFKRDIY